MHSTLNAYSVSNHGEQRLVAAVFNLQKRLVLLCWNYLWLQHRYYFHGLQSAKRTAKHTDRRDLYNSITIQWVNTYNFSIVLFLSSITKTPMGYIRIINSNRIIVVFSLQNFQKKIKSLRIKTFINNAVFSSYYKSCLIEGLKNWKLLMIMLFLVFFLPLK